MPRPVDAEGQPELWAGAECTLNRIGNGFKDQAVLTGHNSRADDLERFARLGIVALRYPLLWETFAHSDDPQRLWDWHDIRLARLRELGVRPILGLVHHGSGPRTTNLLAPDFSTGLAEHAAEAARRFPWIEQWTPVNEPLTTARFSALYGHWYPHLQDETAFWLALLNQIDAVRLSMRAIRAVNPGAKLIQTEDLGHTGATPEVAELAGHYNSRRWASWDMLLGLFAKGHPLWDHVIALGFEGRLASIAADPCPPDILGLNHYLTSDRFLDHRIEDHAGIAPTPSHYGPLIDMEAVRAAENRPGLEGAIRACWERYGRQIALTEIHNGCTREEQMRWLDEAWTTAAGLRADGLGVAAVTVWSLLGAYDWDSLLTRNAGHYETGVFDVRGGDARETAMAAMMRDIASGRRPGHPVLGAAGWWNGTAGACSSSSRETSGQPLLILGATGTLGQAFAGACRLRGIDHVLTGRQRIDLRSDASVMQALIDLQPWAVINCAGWVRVDEAEDLPEDCLAVNFLGNIALAEACARCDIHYTCFSSDLVFSGTSGRPYVESDLPEPLGVYGLSKAQADRALGAAAGRCLVVRTASFFSPYDDHNFAVHLANRLRAGQSFAAASDCVTSPTYVPDLVRATLDLVIDDDRGLRHMVNDGALSWAEFAKMLARELDLPAALVEPKPAAAMGWLASRPAYAPLQSLRGQLLPTLESAIARFAAHPRYAGHAPEASSPRELITL